MIWDAIFTGDIPFRTQLISIVGSFGLLLFTVQLIRGGRLKEGYSLIWFLIALALVVASLFTKVLGFIARAFGISYAPAALFLILLGGLYLLAIHFSLLLHRYDKRIRTLAQKHALLRSPWKRHSK